MKFEADYCLAAVMRCKGVQHFDSSVPKKLIYARCTEGAEKSAAPIVHPGERDIAETLASISNEYMTRFYNSLSEEFGAKFNLALCYEALSLYLRRKYDDVVTVCAKIFHEPEDDSELDKFQFLNVNICFCFNAYFDEDIQALVGFQLLFLHLSSMHDEDLLNRLNADREQYTGLAYADRLARSSFAYENYNKIFSPILRKHFLGNYLVLRCQLDQGFPMFMVRSAFKCLRLRCRFLFERTLVHFLHQKIIRYRCATAYERKANQL